MSYTNATTSALLSLSGNDASAVLDALNAAAQEIDEAFAASGYTVPLNFTTIPDTESRARLESKVRMTEQAIAGRILSQNIAPGQVKAVSPKIAKDYDLAQRWLNRVRESGVPQIGLTASGQVGIGVTGDEVWDTTQYHDILSIPEIWG